MDHLEVYVQQACTQPLSLYKDLGLWGAPRLAYAGFMIKGDWCHKSL